MSEHEEIKSPIQQQADQSPQDTDVQSAEHEIACNVCKSTFSSVSNRRRHQREVHQAVRKQCVICNGTVYSDSALKRHMQRCTGPRLEAELDVTDADDISVILKSRAKQIADSVATGVISDELVMELTKDLRGYLRSSPVTYLEHRILQVRLNDASQKLFLRTMRFLLAILLGLEVVNSPEQLNLRLLCNKSIVIAIHTTLTHRDVGPVRMHHCFLTIAKILLFITSQARRVKPFEANSISSWSVVRRIVDESSKLKKQAASKIEPDERIMSAAQLSEVAKGSLEWLREFCQKQADTVSAITKAEAATFAKYLLTSILSNHPAQRSEVYRLLDVNVNLHKVQEQGDTTGQYMVWEMRIPSAKTKSGKPIVMQFSKQISAFIDVYLETVRPLLIGATTIHSRSNLLFPARDGNARADFSSWTKFVTDQLIGISINPHAFRTSQVTAAYLGASDASSLQALADSMGHTVQTAQTHYRVPQYRQQSALSSVLLQNLYRKAAEEGQQNVVQQHALQQQQMQQQQQIQQQPLQQLEQQLQQQQRLSSTRQLFTSLTQPRLSAVSRTSTAQLKAVKLQSVSIEPEKTNDDDDISDDDIIDITSERMQPALQKRQDVFQRALTIATAPGRHHNLDDESVSQNTELPVAKKRRLQHPRTVLKWSGQEISALERGITKHGTKWHAILKDTELHGILGRRNIAQIKSKGFHLIKQEQRRNIPTSMNDPPAAFSDTDDDTFAEDIQDIEGTDELDNELLGS